MTQGWDVVGWFSTLLVRLAITNDPQEQSELMSEISGMTDYLPELREYARSAGVTSVLPTELNNVSFMHEDIYES